MQNLQYSLTILLALSVTGVQAENLDMPAMDMPDTAKPMITINANLPTRGMDMESTQEQFGVPEIKVPAIGEPPISRWEYDGYTVYFEHEYVLHTVDRSQLDEK